MKRIIISIIVSLFIVGNSFALENNECKAKQYDNKTFFNCLKDFTQNNKNSFGILDGIFGKVDVKINIGDNIKYLQTYDNGYVNNCNINISDKKKFIKTLEKWSTGSFGSSDLEYAKCIFEQINSKKEELSKIDISNLEVIKETSSYKLLKGNNKGYLYNIAYKGTKINGKQLEDSLCEITGSNGEGLRYVGEYLVDNKNIYDDKSSIDGNNGRYNCKINKVNLNYNIDLKTLKYLDKLNLYKGKNGIYYFHGGSFDDLKIIKLENIDELSMKSLGGGYHKDKNGVYYFSDYGDFNKLDNVDINTFEVINPFLNKAQDKNYIYIRGKKKERVKLIKKDNVTINDFSFIEEKLVGIDNSMFNYEFTLKTKIDGNFEFVLKTDIDENTKNIGHFSEGKASFLNTFERKDFNNILGIEINIYDINGEKKDFFDEGKLIGTIKRKIKFTKDMDKPEFVKDEQSKKTIISNKKVDLLLEKFDKKLLNKSLKTKLNIYKKLNFKIGKLKEKYKTGKNIELINYLYEKIHKKFLVTFKNYVLEKKINK